MRPNKALRVFCRPRVDPMILTNCCGVMLALHRASKIRNVVGTPKPQNPKTPKPLTDEPLLVGGGLAQDQGDEVTKVLASFKVVLFDHVDDEVFDI